jgi:MFS family permease
VLVLVTTVWGRGASGLATVTAAAGLPYLFGPLIGVLVDRWRPRSTMLVADGARMVLTAVMVVAPSLSVLAALMLARSAFAVMFSPAQQRLIKSAVPGDLLLSANATNQTAVQLFKIAGPALGGLLVSLTSPRAAIGINAVSFLLSALVLLGLPAGELADRTPERYLVELREGFSFVLTRPALRLMVSTLSITVFMVFMYDAMMPLAVHGLGLSDAFIGYLVAAVGAGGAVGAMLISQWGDHRRPFVLIAAGQSVVGLIVVGLGAALVADLRLHGVVWLLVVGLLGIASAGVLVPFPFVVQASTPDRLIARTWTVMGSVPTVLQVTAPVVAAAALRGLTLGWLFVVAGVGLVLSGTVTVVRQRRLPDVLAADEPPEPEPQSAVPRTDSARGR